MKFRVLSAILVAALAATAFGPSALALDGQIAIHDPSTVMVCDGKYYTFGTSGTALVSDDGWTWRAGTRAPRSGLAPDLIHVPVIQIVIVVGVVPCSNTLQLGTAQIMWNGPLYTSRM